MKQRLISGVVTVMILLVLQLQVSATGDLNNPRSGILKGRVVDATSNKPMEYVNVAVFRVADSSLITGTITNPDGIFKIESIALGEYYLRLSFLGFENLFTPPIHIRNNSGVDLGDMKMAVTAADLQGVSITGERARVEYQIDKRVINVGQDLVSKGGTAANALENTPSVQVDPQGNVMLRGSYDYIVLVDGKPSVLKGSDALKQISAASIKQIEVITNPSAKYEADGKAGIINIIQKKDKLQGLNGNASMSLSTTDKYSANGLINYRKNKVNLFAGIDFARNKYISDLDLENHSYLESGNLAMNENVRQYNRNDNMAGRFGIDYDPDSKNSFSLSGTYGKQGYDNGAHAMYNSQLEGSTRNYFRSNSDMDVTGNVPGLNLDYTHRFAENHTIFISSNYSAWDGVDNNLVTEYSTDESYIPGDITSSLRYRKDNFNYQYRLNVDYKRPVKKSTLEAGFQYRYENRRDDLAFSNLDVETEQWIANPLYTYTLKYRNDIYSGYATFSGQTLWGIGYMAGLRTELFTREINFSNDASTYNFEKFMLYPSLHFSKTVKEKHQFQLSYSRRINRPMPWLLNKTPGYIDPNNIFKGSPELEPEFTDAYEFNYRSAFKKLTISAQSYFRNTTNCFETKRTLDENGIMTHELINASRQQSYGLELGVDVPVTKWWQLSTGADLFHYNLSASSSSDQGLKSVNTWDARLISNFSLKWGTRLQAVGYMRGPRIDTQGRMERFYTVNLAVNQPLMKGKINVGLTAQNIFDSIKLDYKASGTNYENTYSISDEGPSLQLTASYTFNNFVNKQRGRSDDASFRGGGAF